MDMDWQVDISDMQLRLLNIERGSIVLKQNDSSGLLEVNAQSAFGGRAGFRLQGRRSTGQAIDLDLEATLQQVNLPKLFSQASTLTDSRTSGTIKASSSGTNASEIVAGLRGTAELTMDYRQDHDWKRPPKPSEQLEISGIARPVITDDRITGLDISQLALTSLRQNLTGDLSMVEGRKPWLIATLESEKLDIPALMENAFDQGKGKSGPDDLSSLQRLGEGRFSLKARSLRVSTW